MKSLDILKSFEVLQSFEVLKSSDFDQSTVTPSVQSRRASDDRTCIQPGWRHPCLTAWVVTTCPTRAALTSTCVWSGWPDTPCTWRHSTRWRYTGTAPAPRTPPSCSPAHSTSGHSRRRPGRCRYTPGPVGGEIWLAWRHGSSGGSMGSILSRYVTFCHVFYVIT